MSNYPRLKVAFNLGFNLGNLLARTASPSSHAIILVYWRDNSLSSAVLMNADPTLSHPLIF